MRLKFFLKTIILASFLFVFLISPTFAAQCAPGVTPRDCGINTKNCVPCEPESLPQLEIIAVQVIGLIYVLTGIIFFAIFIYNSYLYMFNHIEDSKKRMIQWIIGFLMIMFSQPIVATVMDVLIDDSTDCYSELQQPGFTFFFPQVCDGTSSTNPSGPVGGP
jgi:hypothetical protein